jgi:hypothetical protein
MVAGLLLLLLLQDQCRPACYPGDLPAQQNG